MLNLNILIIFLKFIKRIFINDLFYFLYFKLFLQKKVLKNTNKKKYKEGVTAVITSCNRPNKLLEMLNSLKTLDELNFHHVIFVEDGGCLESVKIIKTFIKKSKLTILYHSKNIGQLKSIDEAYSLVKTRYIFHIEEDWIFLKKGFIDYSIKIMRKNSNIASISLRPHSDFNNFIFFKNDNFYIMKKKFYNLIWSGICINPGLYDKCKYDLISPYSAYKKERVITQVYSQLGFYGAISENQEGYLIHNGDGCSTRKKYKVA